MYVYMPSVYFGLVGATRWLLLYSPALLAIFYFPPKYPFISSLPLCPFLPSSSFPHPSLPPTLFCCSTPPPLPPTSCDSAALGRGRGWSRRTWAACCRCVTSGWTQASCTRCPFWPSARTSWWCGSSSALPISWPSSAAAERPWAGATDLKRSAGVVGVLHADSEGVSETVPLSCECVWNSCTLSHPD